jgi:hypothetical protein
MEGLMSRKPVVLTMAVLSLVLAAQAHAAPEKKNSYVRVFLPEDVPQGPIPFDTEVKVNFAREAADTQNEFDPTTNEFVAAEPGQYLVVTGVRYTNVAQNGDYCVSIRSNSGTQGVVACEKAPQTTSSQFGVDLDASAILDLQAGEKIWVTVNHLTTSNPTIYWRDAVTYLHIARLGDSSK